MEPEDFQGRNAEGIINDSPQVTLSPDIPNLDTPLDEGEEIPEIENEIVGKKLLEGLPPQVDTSAPNSSIEIV